MDKKRQAKTIRPLILIFREMRDGNPGERQHHEKKPSDPVGVEKLPAETDELLKQPFETKKEKVMKAVMPLVLVLAVLIMPRGLFAQQGQTQTPAVQAEPQAQTEPECTMSGKHMKEHGEMMSRMQEMNARLDAKIAAMDAAKGEAKVEAMAAVIKEMASQRKDMQEHMMKMHEMRKEHMMEHMKHGAEGEAGKKKDH